MLEIFTVNDQEAGFLFVESEEGIGCLNILTVEAIKSIAQKNLS
jgi:hypothetical protein